MSNLFVLTVVFLAAALIYQLRRRIIGALRRFEARNVARRANEIRARSDRYAHYRQTVELAEEQVEPVAKITVPDERTGQPVTRFLFLGRQYVTLEEAEAERHAAVIGRAREFYIDLDKIYLGRGRWRTSAADPELFDPTKR
jgi:hypothetical protein